MNSLSHHILRAGLRPALVTAPTRSFLGFGSGTERLAAIMKEEDPEHVSQRIAEESWDSLKHSHTPTMSKAPQVETQHDVDEERLKRNRLQSLEHEMERTGKERERGFPYEEIDVNGESSMPHLSLPPSPSPPARFLS